MIRYVLYCDEAYNAQPELRYHHFFGGLLIEEQSVARLESVLQAAAAEAGLTGEIKWGKVDERSWQLYIRFIETFFIELAKGYFKIRVLFLDKFLSPSRLIKRSRQEHFYTLYYLFITRAFGWAMAPWDPTQKVVLRLFLDQLPDSTHARETFKSFLLNIGRTRRFSGFSFTIPPDGIAEINSKKHRIAQAVDLIIGSLGYRMNNLHKVLGSSGRRGKRTLAKDKVRKKIQQHLLGFGIRNIGITTGSYGRPGALWFDPARLWRLEPKEFTLEKKWIKKKAP